MKKKAILLFILMSALFAKMLIRYKFLHFLSASTSNSAYMRIYNEIVSGKRPLKVSLNLSPDRFGYGNRIFSLLTSIVLAFVTDSAFVITNWSDIQYYIDGPLGNDTFRVFPNDTLLGEFNSSLNSSQSIVLEEVVFTAFRGKRIDELTNYRLPSNFTRIVFGGSSSYFMTICALPSSYERLYNYGLVSRVTITNAQKALDNPTLSEEKKIDAVLQVGFDYAHTMLNKHWLPKPHISEIAERFYKTQMRDYYVIGLQMRTFFLNGEADFSIFAKCALETTRRRAGKEVIKQILAKTISREKNDCI